MTNPFDIIRAYLNDPDGIVFTDKVLAPFAAEAVAMTPRIAAALAAYSRGAVEAGDRLLLMAGVKIPKVPPSQEGAVANKENNA